MGSSKERGMKSLRQGRVQGIGGIECGVYCVQGMQIMYKNAENGMGGLQITPPR